MRETRNYLLLDSWNKPLAKGILNSPEEAAQLQVQILDDQAEALTGHEVVQLVGMNGDDRSFRCRLLRVRGDQALLETLEVLDPELRLNLRIPVCFESFLYPERKRLCDRLPIRSLDLSCGGIAFYCEQGIPLEEPVEIVIPITEQPLIVHSRILRINELKNGRALYAAKFVDLCHDEEKMIRRAVFSIQIRDERRGEDAEALDSSEEAVPPAQNNGNTATV